MLVEFEPRKCRRFRTLFPILWNAQIEYENSEEFFYKSKQLFEGQEMVVVGKLTDSLFSPVPKIDVLSNGDLNDPLVIDEPVDCGKSNILHDFDSSDELRSPNPLPEEIDLEKMYRYMKIQSMLEQLDGITELDARNNMEARIRREAVQARVRNR